MADCYIAYRIKVVEGVEQDMGLIRILNDSHVYTITCYKRALSLSCWNSNGSLNFFFFRVVIYL